MDTPKPINELAPDDIQRMNYSQLIGVVRETARPPGGFMTVQRLASLAFLTPASRVLEVGTSTGFFAHELAWLVGCRIDSIDIDQNCLNEGRRRAEQRGLGELINFQLDNAMDLSFADGGYDLLFCGNMTSLLPDRDKAVSEYIRVLKPGGILAATPMYYVDEIPPAELIRQVSEAQGADFKPQRRAEAIALYQKEPLVPLVREDYRFDRLGDEVIQSFVDMLLAQEHLSALKPETRAALAERYLQFMTYFRNNINYMGFTLALWRKEANPVDGELFTAYRIR